MKARILAVFPIFAIAGCGDPDPVDETHRGRLEEGDSVLEQDGSFYDEYAFKAAEGWNITVSMNSGEFDTYLHLIDPDGNQIATNDDVAAGDSNSRITVTAPSSGEYKVLANSLSGGQTGAYTLTIRAQPAQ